MKMFKRKGQSTLEYAVVIAVIVAGLLAMQHYMNRGIQGKLRQSADDIGEQYSVGKTTRTTTIGYGVQTNEDGFGYKMADGTTDAAGVSWSKVQSAGRITQNTSVSTPHLGSEKLFE